MAAWWLVPWPGAIEPVDKVSSGSFVHESSLIGGAVDGRDETGLEKLAFVEIMDEDETASGAGPPDLVEKEVAEAVIDSTITVELESLRLVGGGADDDIGAEIDEMTEKGGL